MGSIKSDILNNTPFFYNILYNLDIYTSTNWPNNNTTSTNPIIDSSDNKIKPLSYYKNETLPPFVSTFYVYDLFQVKCRSKFTIIYENIM